MLRTQVGRKSSSTYSCSTLGLRVSCTRPRLRVRERVPEGQCGDFPLTRHFRRGEDQLRLSVFPTGERSPRLHTRAYRDSQNPSKAGSSFPSSAPPLPEPPLLFHNPTRKKRPARSLRDHLRLQARLTRHFYTSVSNDA